MARAAAFFDLDRTLLRGASGPVYTAALKEAGVVPDRDIPGEGLLYRVYDLVGETIPSMLLARRAAGFAKGWYRDAVRDAATKAGKTLAGAVQPWAHALIEEHRRAGRPVVMATTTPIDLVEPLADELGFDGVVATRYRVTADGHFDGSIDGPFVWGPGKLTAVRAWAAEHDVDVTKSWAYTDSVYDIPLLLAVAHPHAVNPDPRLLAVATLRRWPVVHLDVPPGVPKVAGVEPWQALKPLMRPELIPFARFDIGDTDTIPTEGPGILVANHRSYFDTAAVGLTAAKAGRPLRFLGKKEVFDAPVIGQLARAMGGIRVERGSGSDEPLHEAARALQAGELVALMPQGTIPRGHAFFEPELKGRWGAARLAKMTKAPVIPLGLWGTEKVWPRSARIPNVANITNPPLVTVRVGPPAKLAYRSLDADTARIMQAITDLLPPEARQRREPTPEELAASFPPGHRPEPGAG